MTEFNAAPTNGAQPCVKILSIGGTGVFGMNCLLIRSPKQKILIDCGVLFPADEDLGVDLITPDFSVLEADAPDVLLVTHAHEDHVGAIPYLVMALKKAGLNKKLPIYGSNFTIAMIKRRLQPQQRLPLQQQPPLPPRQLLLQ